MKATIQKICPKSGVFLFISIIILSIACTKLELADGEKAEAEQNYAKAYQIYATILSERAKKFTAPKPGEITSGKAFGEWIGKVLAAYTLYLVNRPSSSDSVIAAQKLREVEPHLSFVENTITLRRAQPLSEQELIDTFHQLFFSQQKSVPPTAIEAAKKSYRDNYSVFVIKGDLASHVDGLLYNSDRDIGIPFKLEWDSHLPQVVLLPPGKWMAVCVIVREASDPRSKIYFEARDIQGRYAATYFTVPMKSHHLEYVFWVKGAPVF